MKQKTKKVILRKDITQPPTQKEIDCIMQYGQDINNRCLDCQKPLYYFNQCDNCYKKMIDIAKID